MASASTQLSSPDNPRIKAARKLTSRKGRIAASRLLVEGVRLLSDAWQSGARPEIVFYEPSALGAGEALLATLAQAGCACYACTPAVFASLTETVTPQGIAAVLPLPQKPLPPEPTLVLILDGVSDPGNAGTLVRSAEAAGVDGVIFGPDAVDPFNHKVVRAGMGAHFRLPLLQCATWMQVEALLPPLMACYVADAQAITRYDMVDWREPSALVIGSETHGPSTAARQRGTLLAIPMSGGAESLNAAIAGSVILFEAARRRRTQ